MKMQVIEITPTQAAEWLAMNIESNRPINRKRVSFYADQIKRDLWKVSHQGIAFDKNERLLDGQHRLTAIVEADVPVQMAVIYGAETTTFDILDAGMGRSLKDRTGIHKEDVSVCSLFHKISFGEAGAAIPVNDIEYIYGMCQEQFEIFANYRSTIRKGISVAPVQGAVILHMAEGHGTYAAEQYRALVSLDFDTMEPVVRAFYKQTVNGKITGSSSDRTNAMARAYRAFDASEDVNAGHIAIRDESQSQKRLKAKLVKVLDL
jgi:hypothetical protein